MTAALIQGAPGATLDTDLWIDLPERQYMRVMNIANRLGAALLAKTAVALADERMVNFCYRIDGLASFETEYRRANWFLIDGVRVKVMPLERVIRSKEAVGREKDLAVLPLLKSVALSKKATRRKRN